MAARVACIVASVVASATAPATAIVMAAAVTTVTSQNRVVVTAHEGDADDREEHRDAQNQKTIHPKFLHKTGTVPYGNHYAVEICSLRCDGPTKAAVNRPVPVLPSSLAKRPDRLLGRAKRQQTHRLGWLS